jgi:hypothetical protein
MEAENRHNVLITEVIVTAFRIKLSILESRSTFHILTEEDYRNLLEIKKLIAELEELDTLPQVQID